MKAHAKALTAVLITAAFLVWGGYQLQTRYFNPPEPSVNVNVPDSLPELSLARWQGGRLDTASLKGRVVILNFWATWCGPCIEEIPSLIKLSKEMKDRLTIVALSNDDSVEEVKAFMKSFPEVQDSDIEIIHDPTNLPGLVKTFSVGRLPETFVFSREGKLIRKVLGSIDWAAPEAIEYLRTL